MVIWKSKAETCCWSDGTWLDQQLDSSNDKLIQENSKLSVNFIQFNIVYKICVGNHTIAKCYQESSLGQSNFEHAAYLRNPNPQNNPNFNS